MTKKYVYEGKEVATTGRTAIKESRRGNRKHVLYEIRPLELETSDPKFCQWVKLDDLYHIQEDINNNKTEN